MGAEKFLPGDEVLLKATVVKVGLNFLVVQLPQTNSIALEERQLIVFKQYCSKLHSVEDKDPIEMIYESESGGLKEVLVKSVSSVAVLEEILSTNEEAMEKIPYLWVQDLTSPKIKPINPGSVPNVGQDKVSIYDETKKH